MRIRITLDLNEKVIPVNYHSKIQGILYNCLFNYKNISDIHDYGYKFGTRKFKLFTFSELYGKSEFLKDLKKLLFKSNAYFEFTSYDDDLILALSDFFVQNKSVIFCNQIVEVVSFIILDDNINTQEFMEFKTISPITTYITTEDKKTKYFSPDEKEFAESIINNLAKKYFLIYKENMPNIEIKEIYNIKQKRVYFRNSFAICYHCTIKFSHLTTKILKVMLTCGIGSKNSSGFGMLNIHI